MTDLIKPPVPIKNDYSMDIVKPEPSSQKNDSAKFAKYADKDIHSDGDRSNSGSVGRDPLNYSNYSDGGSDYSDKHSDAEEPGIGITTTLDTLPEGDPITLPSDYFMPFMSFTDLVRNAVPARMPDPGSSPDGGTGKAEPDMSAISAGNLNIDSYTDRYSYFHGNSSDNKAQDEQPPTAKTKINDKLPEGPPAPRPDGLPEPKITITEQFKNIDTMSWLSAFFDMVDPRSDDDTSKAEPDMTIINSANDS
ncbi:MAG: hypothetical protein AAFZ92_00660 [Pseudomonadota bacterium]